MRFTEGRSGGSASGDMDMVSSDATVRWIPLDRESLDLCLESESGLCSSEAVLSICAVCFGGMVWIVGVPVLYSVVG